MKVYTVVLHIELEEERAVDDPALWNWSELLDLGSLETCTVDEVYDEPVARDQESYVDLAMRSIERAHKILAQALGDVRCLPQKEPQR